MSLLAEGISYCTTVHRNGVRYATHGVKFILHRGGGCIASVYSTLPLLLGLLLLSDCSMNDCRPVFPSSGSSGRKWADLRWLCMLEMMRYVKPKTIYAKQGHMIEYDELVQAEARR